MLFFIKNNPKKLYDKYKSINKIYKPIGYDFTEDTNMKEAIIVRLIELDAEDELLNIFSTDEKNQVIQNYLFEKYKDNPERLYWLYPHFNNKLNVIVKLIELDAETQILKIFINDKADSIQKYLFNKYEENPEKLYWLYPIFKDQQKIIKKLIELNAIDELEKNYLNKGYNELFIRQLLTSKENNIKEIYKLYIKLHNFAEKISVIEKLVKLNAEDELNLIINKKDFKGSLEFYIISNLQNRDKNPKKNIEEVEKLIVKYMGNLITHIQKDDIPVTNWYMIALSYIDFLSKTIDPKAVHYIILNNFSYFFSKGLNSNKDFIRLCSFLDGSRFQESIQKIERNFIICNKKRGTINIKKKYAELIKNATSKNDVEMLITKKNKELSNLFDKDELREIQYIYSIFNFNLKLDDDRFLYSKDKYILAEEKFLSNIILVSNLKNGIEKVNSDLLNQLQNIEDSDLIMKIKAEANKKINSLATNDTVIGAIYKLGLELADDKRYIHKLGKMLLSNIDIGIKKAILCFSAMSNNFLWLDYIAIMPNYDNTIAVLVNLKNRLSVKNFNVLLRLLESQNRLHNDRFKKQIIISIIEHLLSVTLDKNVNNIDELSKLSNSELLEHLGKLQVTFKRIVQNNIDKIGKESKVIEITVGNKPESKDIEIKH